MLHEDIDDIFGIIEDAGLDFDDVLVLQTAQNPDLIHGPRLLVLGQPKATNLNLHNAYFLQC